MNSFIKRYHLLLLVFLGGCSSLDGSESKTFASEHEAAVHFIKPIFPLLDCEAVGVISKGEVDEHFFQVFYTFAERRSFSFSQDDLSQKSFTDNEEKTAYLFNWMDQDDNGVVSTKEFRNFMNMAIDLIDTEKNGEITLKDVGIEMPEITRANER